MSFVSKRQIKQIKTTNTINYFLLLQRLPLFYQHFLASVTSVILGDARSQSTQYRSLLAAGLCVLLILLVKDKNLTAHKFL